MMKLNTSVLCLLLMYSCVHSYKILLLNHMPGSSHGILFDAHARNLLAAGHQVTHATTFPPKYERVNETVIDMSDVMAAAIKQKSSHMKDIITNRHLGTTGWRTMLPYIRSINNMTLYHPRLQAVLRDPDQQFDAVITNWLFQDIYDMIGGALRTNIITFIPTEPHTYSTRRFDSTSSPALHINLMTDDTLPYDFIGRVKSLINYIKLELYIHFSQMPYEKAIYMDSMTPVAKARGIELPDYDEVNRNISLILCNTHESLMQAQSLPLNVKLIGGYHIDPVVPPLPKDLQDIMDNSMNGVILFSLGTNIKSADLTDDIINTIKRVFSNLKETVIWKLEKTITNLPRNVLVRNWMPQASILAHPHIKLFITHGGMLSNLEAIHYGVPVVGVPIFADQFLNMEKAEQRGYGIKVDILNNFDHDFEHAVNEMLNNSTRREKITELSRLFYDRRLSPIDESVYWIEYVIRTNGAKHLRSVTRDVPLYQKLYLDLLTLVVIIFIILFIIIKIIFKMLFNKVKNVNISKKEN